MNHYPSAWDAHRRSMAEAEMQWDREELMARCAPLLPEAPKSEPVPMVHITWDEWRAELEQQRRDREFH